MSSEELRKPRGLRLRELSGSGSESSQEETGGGLELKAFTFTRERLALEELLQVPGSFVKVPHLTVLHRASSP